MNFISKSRERKRAEERRGENESIGKAMEAEPAEEIEESGGAVSGKRRGFKKKCSVVPAVSERVQMT